MSVNKSFRKLVLEGMEKGAQRLYGVGGEIERFFVFFFNMHIYPHRGLGEACKRGDNWKIPLIQVVNIQWYNYFFKYVPFFFAFVFHRVKL